MRFPLIRIALAAGFSLLAAQAALATPVLRADVTVTAQIVTVGDLFDDAGMLAEQALFRAPQPGTAGTLTLADIASAAARVGLSGYLTNGVTQVRVARQGVVVDQDMLRDLIDADLESRGILTSGMTAQIRFDQSVTILNAASDGGDPARLESLRYQPGNASFSARFVIAGQPQPLDVTGSLDLMIEVPHLAANLPAGTVLGPDNIQMKLVPLKFAETSGYMALDQIVGMALQRPSREGMMLKPSDVAVPQLISRNETVVLILQSGPMTLTVKGQALNSAAKGEAVAVINDISHQVVHGVALSSGTVEVPFGPTAVAGL